MFYFWAMVKDTSRRHFLRSAPLAAAAGLVLPAAEVAAQAVPTPFKLIPASELGDALAGLEKKPGNFNVYDAPTMPFTAVLTVEEKHAATQFEWHEGRDHLLQVMDGTTVYEIGGTPRNGRNTKPGEWLAPESEGATTLTLHKGDFLVIPRGTPHKRSTAGSVTFYLISTTGSVPKP